MIAVTLTGIRVVFVCTTGTIAIRPVKRIAWKRTAFAQTDNRITGGDLPELFLSLGDRDFVCDAKVRRNCAQR
jgi:hypothetical protein